MKPSPVALLAALALIALGAASAMAQTPCPAGYSYQTAGALCVSAITPGCPTRYTWNTGYKACVLAASGPTLRKWMHSGLPYTTQPICKAGYRYRAASSDCFRSMPASCPSGTHLNPRLGRCVSGPGTPL